MGTIVIVYGGKREDVDTAEVKIFNDYNEAKIYTDNINIENNHLKYWLKAEIIDPDETIELVPPATNN